MEISPPTHTKPEVEGHSSDKHSESLNLWSAACLSQGSFEGVLAYMNKRDPMKERSVLGTQFLDGYVKCEGGLRHIRLQSRVSIRTTEQFFIKGACDCWSVFICYLPGEVIISKARSTKWCQKNRRTT